MSAELSEAEAETYIGEHCFTAGRPHLVGVELEWLLRFAGDAAAPVGSEVSESVVVPLEADPLPRGGRVTREPGGQVELSSHPAEGLAACVADVRSDLAVIAAALAGHGLVIEGGGVDHRPPVIVVDDPRYRAMEAYYTDKQAAYTLMCGTASIQVNLDAGEEDGVLGWRRRWALAHRLGPVLNASFANSPTLEGRPSGWKSTRQTMWWRLDRTRTRPVEGGGDPRAAWTRYALDAGVLCFRREVPEPWDPPPGLTFRSWLRGACAERGPTMDDLRYHLGTLFPPVRPRGWLELRMIDAQPGEDWTVPLALAWALFDDPAASVAAWEATEPLIDGGGHPPWQVWERAARDGLADPALRAAAEACFAAAGAALDRADVPARVRTAVRGFAARYVERGRCPADDRLAAASQEVPS
ncbi:ergothioneine biosynthesis glutamate--cysteine ligase EgtA [Glycomyces arizonensis]|uniref:ergothioneine biosynthesis glutamate--cysteine ligase EgtA n=1 Tax=Glycomyces arizonensis TaxID=256035 RepID=UPI000406F805|nr:ergothioneine biosynthesis glutamate--cysteine ligase EgtA [Glycomyces arizonensis]